MEAKAIFGRNVQRARKTAGLTQEALAVDAKMAKSYLSDVERGRRNPTIEVVSRIALALDIEAAALMDGIPDRNATTPHPSALSLKQ